MNIKGTLCLTLVLVCAIAMFGCQKLDVQNQNLPDQGRSVGTPEDLQSLVSGTFQGWMEATHWYTPDALSTAANALTCSWGNFSMRDISWEPRKSWDNTTTYNYRYVSEDPWYGLYATISACNDALKSLKSGEIQFGANGEDTNRGIAFAKFVQGISHGYVALYFDQGYIFDENVDLASEVLELKPHGEIMAAAISQLEEAISLATQGFPNDIDGWINGVTLSGADLAKLAHSFAARFIASVGRDPAARAASDWNAVMAHVNAGITDAFTVDGDGANVWWMSEQWYHSDGLAKVERGASRTTWARADYHLIGGSDKSSNYQNWLATPSAQRNQFEMDTDDKRIWSGNRLGPETPFEGLQEKGLYFNAAGPSPWPATRGTYHYTEYAMHRYESFRNNSGVGLMYLMLKEEMDFLKAEGLLRTGSAGEARTIINNTRTANGGYDALDGSEAVGNPSDARSSLPGSSLWANLKYEKGLEVVATGAGITYFDNRGWGDLQTGTILHFPVPAKELQVLQLAVYTFGGAGSAGSAPKISRQSKPPAASVVE